MDYFHSYDSTTDLASRLARKTGFPEEQAQKFLEALSELNAEQAPGGSSLIGSPIAGEPFSLVPRVHTISIPLVEQQDGTMIVDDSSLSAWSFLPKTRPVPGLPPNPGQPATPPNKPQKPPKGPGTYPGAYPGPSVLFDPRDQESPSRETTLQGGAYPGPSILIALHDPQGTALDPGKVNLMGLSEALTKATLRGNDEGLSLGNYEKLNER